MGFEVIGKLIHIGDTQSGQGRNGDWRKREFVIETSDSYPKQICFLLWNDKTEQLDQLQINEIVKVRFTLASREYNGRWYTDATAYAIERRSLNEYDYPPAVEQPETALGVLCPKDGEEDLPF